VAQFESCEINCSMNCIVGGRVSFVFKACILVWIRGCNLISKVVVVSGAGLSYLIGHTTLSDRIYIMLTDKQKIEPEIYTKESTPKTTDRENKSKFFFFFIFFFFF
jgi:hypothetical protein